MDDRLFQSATDRVVANFNHAIWALLRASRGALPHVLAILIATMAARMEEPWGMAYNDFTGAHQSLRNVITANRRWQQVERMMWADGWLYEAYRALQNLGVRPVGGSYTLNPGAYVFGQWRRA